MTTANWSSAKRVPQLKKGSPGAVSRGRGGGIGGVFWQAVRGDDSNSASRLSEFSIIQISMHLGDLG